MIAQDLGFARFFAIEGIAGSNAVRFAVIPAKAGTHLFSIPYKRNWIPAFAGMTSVERKRMRTVS
jgi:hypothetical protein